MATAKKRSKAVHDISKKQKVKGGRKSPGFCTSCYEYVDYTYMTNGKVQCHYCSRGIKR